MLFFYLFQIEEVTLESLQKNEEPIVSNMEDVKTKDKNMNFYLFLERIRILSISDVME